MDSGFHTRLKDFVCQRHEQQETFTLSDLRDFTLDEGAETEEYGDAMFLF